MNTSLKDAIQNLQPSDPQYEEKWKRHWLKAAEVATGSLQICEHLGTTLAEYFRRRKADPKFDAECLLFDQLIELRIIENIRQQSQSGEIRAQGLNFKNARRAAFDPGFPSWNPAPRPDAPVGSMPSEIAAAMIKAGLDAAAKYKNPPLPDDPPPTPEPSLPILKDAE
jgi:hypothetical protein